LGTIFRVAFAVLYRRIWSIVGKYSILCCDTRTERASQAEGRTEEEAEDIDQPSDKEEDTGTGRRRAPKATQVKFPTEEEFQKGYIWGPSFQFDAAFDNIRTVQHVETNHRCLFQQRVRDM
jgi:hypothetical protein